MPVLTPRSREMLIGLTALAVQIPSGNAPGNTTWTTRKARPGKPEVRLTPGKGVQDLTVPMETLIDQVSRAHDPIADNGRLS